MKNEIKISWDMYGSMLNILLAKIRATKLSRQYDGVYGVPRGGIIVAVFLSHNLNLPLLMTPTSNTLVCDDISDTGATLSNIKHKDIACLYNSEWTNKQPRFYVDTKYSKNDWISFPYENAYNINEDKMNWFISGFVEGEGCFCVNINKRKDIRLGYEVRPVFTITQHVRSLNILEHIKRTLKMNETVKIYRTIKPHLRSLNCQNNKTLYEIVIPFFEKYELQGDKKRAFNQWKYIVHLKYNKQINNPHVLALVMDIARHINKQEDQR